MLRFAKLRLLAVTWTGLWLLAAGARAEELTLDNGLRVVLAPDASVDKVALVVSYEAGSANDPARYRGIAHLLDHLTFRGSRHMRAQQGFDLIEAPPAPRPGRDVRPAARADPGPQGGFAAGTGRVRD